ncbi:transposase, partial [human gut metagenome]
MARISVNGIAKEIYTQCRTAVDKWDPAKGRATGRDRLSYEVNAYIDDFRAKVIEIYRTLQAEGFEGNAIEIKERLKSPGKQVRM